MNLTFLKKIMPSKEALQKNRFVQWLNPWLTHSPNYWKFNMASVSRGVAIGVFNAFMPMPFQTLIALLLAIPLRANLILTFGLLWINNPFTVVPIYLLTYKIGAWMLNEHLEHVGTHVSWAWLSHQIGHVWKPFLLGCTVTGLFFGIISYFVILIFWKFMRKSFEQNAVFKG